MSANKSGASFYYDPQWKFYRIKNKLNEAAQYCNKASDLFFSFNVRFVCYSYCTVVAARHSTATRLVNFHYCLFAEHYICISELIRQVCLLRSS